eukprot:gene162-4408_t
MTDEFDRDFLITAWPLISHQSNKEQTESEILWPLFKYTRYTKKGSDGNNYEEKFYRINPFLFSLKQNNDPNQYEFTIQLFFYSFYLSIYDSSQIFFFLPLFLYYSYCNKKKRSIFFIFGGLIYSYKNNIQQRYLHILPLYFENIKKEENKIRILFPFYFKFKFDSYSFSIILPLYFYYKSSTFYLNHLLFIFGYIETFKNKNEFKQWSICFPFIIYSKYKKYDGFIFHILWPLFKLKKKDNYKSLRIFPFCWLRTHNDGYSGYILFGYLKNVNQINRKYYYWGIFGIIHIKREISKVTNQIRNITFIFLIYFDRIIEDYEFRIITPFYITYYSNKDKNGIFKKVIKLISPIYYLIQENEVEYFSIIPLFLYFNLKKIEFNIKIYSLFLIHTKLKNLERNLYLLSLYHSKIKEDLLTINDTTGTINTNNSTINNINSYDKILFILFFIPIYCKIKSNNQNLNDNYSFKFYTFFYISEESKKLKWYLIGLIYFQFKNNIEEMKLFLIFYYESNLNNDQKVKIIPILMYYYFIKKQQNGDYIESKLYSIFYYSYYQTNNINFKRICLILVLENNLTLTSKKIHLYLIYYYFKDLKQDLKIIPILMYYHQIKLNEFSIYIYSIFYYFNSIKHQSTGFDEITKIYLLIYKEYKFNDKEIIHLFLIYYFENVKNQYTIYKRSIYYSYKNILNGDESLIIFPFYFFKKQKQNQWKLSPFLFFEYKDLSKNYSILSILLFYYHSKSISNHISNHFYFLFPFYISNWEFRLSNQNQKDSVDHWKSILFFYFWRRKENEYEFSYILIYYHSTKLSNQDNLKIVFPFYISKIGKDSNWYILPLFFSFIKTGEDPILILLLLFFKFKSKNDSFLFFWIYGSLEMKNEINEKQTFSFYLLISFITYHFDGSINGLNEKHYYLFLILSQLKFKENFDEFNNQFLFLPLLFYLESSLKKVTKKKDWIILSLFLIFYSNSIGRFIFSFIYCEYKFNNYNIILTPIYIKYQYHFDHFSQLSIHLILFGLFSGYIETIKSKDNQCNEYQVNQTFWILLFFKKSKKISNELVSIFITIFPIFFYISNEQFKFIILIPIFCSLTIYNSISNVLHHSFDITYISILFLFYFYLKTERLKIIDLNTFLPLIFSISFSKLDGTFDFRFIYLFTLALCRYEITRSLNYKNTHIYSKMIYLFPIFYWNTNSLRSKLQKKFGEYKISTNEIDLLLDEYIEDEKHSYFDILFIWKSYSLIHFEFDTTHYLYWIFPLIFSSKYDSIESNDFYLNHKQFSILFFLHPYISLFNKTKHIKKDIEEDKIIIFLLYYSNHLRNIKSKKKQFEISILWFLHPFLTLIKFKKNNEFILFFIQPIFLYFKKNENINYIELFWLFHRRLSFIGYQLKDTFNQFYIFPLYYQSNKDNLLKIYKILYLPIPWNDSIPISIINYKLKMKSINTLEEKSYHFLLLFYYEQLNDDSKVGTGIGVGTGQNELIENNLYLFWLFYKKIALSGRLSNYESQNINEHYTCHYFYPLYLNIIQESNNIQTYSFSLFWFLNRFISLFHFESLKNNNNSNDQYLCHLFSIFYYFKNQKVNKLYIFYFIHQQLSLIQYWKNEISNGFYIYPFYHFDQFKNSKRVYMFYFFYKKISVYQKWKNKDNNGFFVFPWIYFISTNQIISSNQNSKKQTTHIFYFFHPNLSLIQYWKNNKIDSICNGYYIYPIIYYEENKNQKNYIYYLFYFLNKHISLIQRWKYNDSKSISSSGFYIYLMIHYDSNSNSNTLYGLYLFYKSLSFIQIWNILNSNSKEIGFYFYPFIYKYDINAISNNVLNENGYSIFYLTKYLSLIHYSIIEKDITFYCFILYYYKLMNDVNIQSYSIFWLFKNQISLIYLNKNKEEYTFWIILLILIQNLKDYYSFNIITIPYWFKNDSSFSKISTSSFIKYYKYSLNNESYFYIFPWILISNKMKLNDNENVISILWIFHSKISIFYYNRYINSQTIHVQSYLLFIYHFEKYIKNSTMLKYNLYFIWFFYKKISLFEKWIQSSNELLKDEGILLFLIFRYQNKTDYKSTNETSFCLFWFWSNLFSIFYVSKISSKQSLLPTYKSFLLLLFYFNQNENRSELFLFWIIIKRISLSQIWRKKENYGLLIFLLTRLEIKTKSKNSITDTIIGNNQLTNDQSIYFSLIWIFNRRISLFYFEKDNDLILSYSILIYYFYKKEKENEFCMFYLLYYKISLFSIIYSFYNNSEYFLKGIYIFYLFRLESKKDEKNEIFSISIFWLLHKYVSIFYLERKKENERIIDTMYLITIFYVERESDKLFKLAIFWYFLRQISFIRFSYLPKDVKILLFPIFKYQRKRGEFSRWCLFPLIPIKYSFVANILVYEKEVFKLGTIINRIEDKTKRRNYKRIRFLYRVFRWSENENGVIDVEFNPFYYSHSDGKERKSQWLCCGGLCGLEEIPNNSKTKVKKDLRYCCCLYCNMGTEDFVDKGKYSSNIDQSNNVIQINIE